MGTLSINVNNKVERPIVQDNYAYLNAVEYVFGIGSFTKGFTDPHGGTYSQVSLETLPEAIELFYLGNPILAGSTFPASDSANLKFVLNPKYAIHNGILYEFGKTVDNIITEYKGLGYELIFNTNGLLTFANITNLSDIVYVQGKALPDTQLQFQFATSSSESNLFSEEATFSLIPWENVNLKDNYLDLGGADGDSAYQVAVNNGFVGTETEWLASLEGAQGPQGEQGIKGTDGADGTSVVIKGTLNSTSELPNDGTQTNGDGYIIGQDLHVWDGSAWVNVGQIKGPKGDPGVGLEFIWDGTKLGVRREGSTVYSFSDLKGAKGDQGVKGDQGIQGFKGDTGLKGDKGATGATGATGPAGADGANGLSAYEVWLAEGNTGTRTQYIASLKGEKGDTGAAGSDAQVDNELKVYKIPVSELLTTPTDANIEMLISEWFGARTHIKLDIQTIAWETVDDVVIVTTWDDSTMWDDTKTWTE